MAVPKEKVVIRLKAFADKANLSNTRIDEISARLCSLPADDADDAAIDSVITNANAIYPFKEIAAQDDRVIGLQNQLKKPEEKTAEVLAAEAKAKADAEALEAAKTKPEIPDYIKALMTTMEGLKADIVEVKTGKVLETKRLSAAEAFEKSEVLKALKPEIKQNWVNRLNVDSETTIEDQITGLETEYKTIAQAFADSSSFSGPAPMGNPDIKPDQALIDKVFDEM